jgi:hypothetical protein
MANEAIKRLNCLWKGCVSVFDDAAAFQEHVTKHGQQLNWDNHDNMEEEEPLAKKAKLDENKNEMANQIDER